MSGGSKRERGYTRLSTQLMGWFLTVALLPLGIAVFAAHRSYEASLREEVAERLFAIADGISARIEEYAATRIEDISMLATESGVKAAVAYRPPGAAMASDDERGLRESLENHRRHHKFSNIFIVSPGGILLFALEPVLPVGVNLEQEPFVQTDLARIVDNTRTLLATAVSRFTFQPGVDEPTVFVASPIHGSRKELLGVLVAQIDQDDIYRWAEDYAGLGETGEIILAGGTPQGAVLVAPLRHDRTSAFRQRVLPAEQYGRPLQQAILGSRGQGLTTDYRGQEVLARWEYLPSFGWGLMVKVDTAEAFEPIRRLRTFVGLLVGLTTPGVILLALWAARSISGPIRRLTEATCRVAAGHFDQRVESSARNELGELAHSFNKMAADLESSTRTQKDQADALRQLNDSLEAQVRERTRALEAHARELARSNQELERFAYVASHDLQEPLRTVASYVQLLQRRYGDRLDGDAREFISYAVDGVQRMKQLINDLLAYSRIGRQGQRFQMEPLEEVLAEVLASLALLMEETGAVVTHEPLPVVRCDRGLMVQLLGNLIGNAVKFRRPEEPPRVHLGAARVEGGWRLWVKDNGIGIDPRYAERLFVLFQRLHTRAEYAGTGIGLAICKKVVEHHGGRIWLESEEGKGSTFLFTLPDHPPGDAAVVGEPHG